MPNIRYLLFDLDDTLYTNTSGLFNEVGDRIGQWTAEALGLSLTEAEALRRTYYRTYGTTMAGLLREHPEVDIDAYLDYVHDIDVARYLDAAPDLAAMLESLSVPKAVFTNSIADWAERVTRQLGVRHHFEHIFDVRAVGYRSKPDPHAYSWVLERLGLPGEACVMLDDQPTYLLGAAEAGMTTVLVRSHADRRNGDDAIDYAVDHVLDAEPILQRLLKN
ncbi:MAG: pyrimidine 5'-nucleotidase [Anaerolineae bacterium]